VGLRRVDEVLIRTRDGVELAANVWLPAGGEPSAVLVSAYPYRKDDVAGAFNEYWRRRFAQAGYGTVLVDCRGTGASRGRVAAAATAQQEALDGYDVVEWTARQPWCSGAVGVWGMSYAGALALATAAMRPPHLRAVACAFGYADSYQDSVFPGGCPAALGRFAREAFMLALALAPPAGSDPAGRWREVWQERLAEIERQGPESLQWVGHPDRDDYWQALEVEVERIEVPTLLVAGWHDLYPAAMARVYGRLLAPKRMLVGPWLHVSPELAERERIDWLGELVAWWQGTLSKDQQRAPAHSVTYFAEGVGGGWRRSAGWPPPAAAEISLYIGEGGALVPDAGGSDGATEYDVDPTVGATAGLLDPLGIGVGYPLDQGPDERASLCFTSASWTEDIELAGSPALELSAEVPGRLGPSEVMVSAKLSDIAPDGSSTLITRGWLDVSAMLSDASHAGPRPILLELRPAAYRLPAGHRLRLALAGADFPAVWPAPSQATVRVHHGGAYRSRVTLPVVRGETVTPPPPIGPSPELSPWDAGGAPGWTIERDQVEQGVAVTLAGRGALDLPGGARFELEHTARAFVSRAHPERAGLDADAQIQITVPGREPVTVQARGSHSRTTMAYEGTVWVADRVVFAQAWETNGGEAT
jgi:hypothetical protein